MVYGMSLGATAADDEEGEGGGGFGTRLVPTGKRVSFFLSFNFELAAG
jgi:hypothetical protein